MAKVAESEWWRGAVLYQIYPRSFLDSNGDGIGDLRGITQKLDYVASLGVDGIWVSPFFTSPMKDFGYDVADYRDIDPIFGTLDDFDAMLARAHNLGLKVVIDQVYSHTSDQHQWFEESRASKNNERSDWYIWMDAKRDGSPPNNWQSVFSCPAWSWDARRQQYYMHNFLPEQPDLNLHNSEVQDALLEVAKFWLERGVDGFRLDAINCGMHDLEFRDNPPAPDGVRDETRPCFMQDRRYQISHGDMPVLLERLRTLTDEYGDIMTVAEVGDADPVPIMKEYTAGDTRLNTAYSFEFLTMQGLSADAVRKVLSDWPGEAGEGWPSWAFSNHDAPRVASRWDDDPLSVRLIAMFQMCLRGNVFVYQGEELGLGQVEVPYAELQDPEAINNWPHTMGRDGARTPMPWTSEDDFAGFSEHKPWLPVGDDHAAASVAVQDADTESNLAWFRTLIELRKQSPALRVGELELLDSPTDVLAFRRSAPGEQVLCVFNLGNESVEWRPGQNVMVIAAVGDADADRLGPGCGYIGRLSND